MHEHLEHRQQAAVRSAENTGLATYRHSETLLWRKLEWIWHLMVRCLFGTASLRQGCETTLWIAKSGEGQRDTVPN